MNNFWKDFKCKCGCMAGKHRPIFHDEDDIKFYCIICDKNCGVIEEMKGKDDGY